MNAIIKSVKKRGFDVINYVCFGLYAIIAIYPLYYIYINAISDPAFVSAGKIIFYPKQKKF